LDNASWRDNVPHARSALARRRVLRRPAHLAVNVLHQLPQRDLHLHLQSKGEPGALVLTALPHVINVNAEARLLVYGLVLILTILLMPRGIVGLLARRRRAA